MISVSIIIPSYNQGEYLDEALQSVFDQNYQYWECIIVNDGSTDDTEDVALDWCSRDSRFKYLKKDNGGLSSARNKGIGIAVGNYILPLDADDYLDSSFLIKVLDEFQKDLAVRAVGTCVQFVGCQTGVHKLTGGNLVDVLNQNITVASTVFRKVDFIEIGGYDETMKLGYEDWEFWIRLLSRGGKIKVIDEPLFFYRKRNDSMITQTILQHSAIYKSIVTKHNQLFLKYFQILLIIKEDKIMDCLLANEAIIKELKFYRKSRFIQLYKKFQNLFSKFK